jgi:hypothetical protein
MSSTPSQIKDRVVTILGAVSGITTVLDDYPEDNEPFTAAELPACVVRLRGATNAAVDGRGFAMTRTVAIILHAARSDEDIKYPDTNALEAIETFLLSIPAAFNARRRLNSDDGGLAGVTSITLPADDGRRTIVHESAWYFGAIFSMTVTTQHR